MEAIILIIFVLGYLAIAFEHPIKVNKAAAALITGVLTWTVYLMLGPSDPHHGLESLSHHISDIAQILFFLIGAMTIVELVDVHGGFDVLTKKIDTKSKVKLLWIVSLATFFLSSVLDNLTTAIVMVSLLSKLIEDKKDRLIFAGMVIVAANAGGAWSPIGDVTTTMLWIKDKFAAEIIMYNLFLPSLICLLVPVLILSFKMRGNLGAPSKSNENEMDVSPLQKRTVLILGIGGLIFVPVFKIVTHLPPFMGMMLSLGVLWVVTELMHVKKRDKYKAKLSASHALERIDTPSMLFFLGILLAVAALEVSGLLTGLATWLDTSLPNRNLVVVMIGLLSSIVDNVPLVAGAIEMYPVEKYPELGHNAAFWQFLAYCAGTGGSVLIIGSAAGVAVMGIEKIDFFWYVKQISWLALLGYLAGAAVYLLMQAMGLLA